MRLIDRAAAGLLALASAPAWAGSPPGIVGGEPTTSDPAVVALATVDVCQDLVDVYCTGTLIAPRVVLTAAHCVNQPVEIVEVFFGDDASGEGQWLRAAALRAHAGFDPLTYEQDIGAVILGEDAPVEPAAINLEALSAATIGADARIVGFGVTEPGGGERGVKRTGQTSVSAVEAGVFETVPNPAMSCQVDSGGPVFLTSTEGVEVLAGLTSNGDAFCQAYAVNTRVDAYLVDFLDPVLAEAATGELVPVPAPSPEDCPGCSVLGCGPDEICDAETDRCVAAEAGPDPDHDHDRGCAIVASLAPPGARASALLLLLVVVRVRVRVRRRRSQVTDGSLATGRRWRARAGP